MKSNRSKLENRTLEKARRKIVVDSSSMHELISQALEAIGENSDAIYQRGGFLVHVALPPLQTAAAYYADNTPTMLQVSSDFLREQLDIVTQWFTRSENGRAEEKYIFPPTWVARNILARRQWPRVRVLQGVATSPTFRPDGTLIEQRGYDGATGLLYEPSEKFPAIPEKPNRDDACAALNTLLYPFRDFVFKTECDRSAMLAAILSIVGRHAIIGQVPMFAIRASTPGTGKTLLANCISLIGTGTNPPIMTVPRDEDECRKRISAIALSGDPIIVVDNIEGPFGLPSISAAVTTGIWGDRNLGNLEMIKTPIRAVWIATGNNIVFRGDLGRRSVAIDILAPFEHPEDRPFENDLLDEVRSDRPALYAAALTILRAFCEARRPKHGGARMGSFPKWDDLVRSALIWLGLADPCGGAERIREEGDEDLDALRVFCGAWRAAFGDSERIVNQAIEEAKRNSDLALAIAQLAGCDANNLDSRKVGNALRKKKERIVDGLHLQTRGRDRNGVAKWCVVQASGSQPLLFEPEPLIRENEVSADLEERAAIIEFDAGQSRARAEELARQRSDT